jgi:5-carboxymethyl-2-hydroxymuconate isomerase
MPHIILEVSNNILESDFRSALLEIHQILVETLPTELNSCKSRVIRYQDYLIAEGDSKYAFAHLWINVLTGRTEETLNLTAEKITASLQNHLKESAQNFKLKISVALGELPAVYHRIG